MEDEKIKKSKINRGKKSSTGILAKKIFAYMTQKKLAQFYIKLTCRPTELAVNADTHLFIITSPKARHSKRNLPEGPIST